MSYKSKYERWMADEDHYKVKEHWDGWAGNFHRYQLKTFKKILKDLNVNKKTKILEIGCGTSSLGEIFSKDEIPKIIAFDIAKPNIQRGRKKFPYIKFLIDDAQKPNLKGTYDILFATEIIEHLSDPKEAIKNWIKLLKKDGYLIISTPNAFLSKKDKEHISLISIFNMKKIIKELNLTLIKTIGIDLFIPFLGRLSNHLKKIPKLSNFIYGITVKSSKKTPILARDIVYIIKK